MLKGRKRAARFATASAAVLAAACLTVLTATWVTLLAATSPDEDGRLLSTTACVLPAYGAAAGVAPYASPSEYAVAVDDRKYSCERLVYASDGLPVVAYFYTARDRATRPLVVFNRGSYVQPEIAYQLVPLFHRLAERGYAVIAPMYRGSAGAPGVDEMGGADVHDLLNVVPLARQLPIDATRLFLYGESRGGMMTFIAIREHFPARAAATFGGFTDLGALMGSAPERYAPLIPRIWPDFAARRSDILRSRSAQSWADALDVPLLLMHGGADKDVDPRQTLALASRLQELHKPYELHIFDGDNHVLTAHRRERDEMAAGWFSRTIRLPQ